MKKVISPPENWQDFESLCKKLFGELWNCSLKIKKNGRLGQPQAGIDVYAIPEGKNKYWGIQCKGKDNYVKSTLSKTEIDQEILKARDFKPELEVFIFCTTAVKNSQVEEYIRLIDIENRKAGSFEILLYSWEDIADLIEGNQDTYNWYVKNFPFHSKTSVEISISGENGELIVYPKFKRVKKIFRRKTIIDVSIEQNTPFNPARFLNDPVVPFFLNDKINLSWCSILVNILNTGNTVIEDWKFYLQFESVRKVDDDFKGNVFNYKELSPYRTTWAYNDENMILYKPLNDKPLVQKDSKGFTAYFIPNMKHDLKETIVKWKLIARDFNIEGENTIKIEPEFIDEEETIWVTSSHEEQSKIEYHDFIEKRSNESDL